jgi:hypothetical protein
VIKRGRLKQIKKLSSCSPIYWHVHIESIEGSDFGMQAVVLRTSLSTVAYIRNQFRKLLIVPTKKISKFSPEKMTTWRIYEKLKIS